MNLHITTKDKLDCAVMLISLADVVWVIGEVTTNGLHNYHIAVISMLCAGTLLSGVLMYKLFKRHHTAHLSRLRRRDEQYVPYVRQGNK